MKCVFSISTNLIYVMIEIRKCCWGFYKKPKMDTWEDDKILLEFDPLKELSKNIEGDFSEAIYDSEKLRYHLLENNNVAPDKYDPFNLFIYSLVCIEKVVPWAIKILALNENKYILAYERFEDEEDTGYFEKFLLELIRLSHTLIIDHRPEESLDDILNKLKTHVKYNTQFNDED